jgi:hypothetical protein
VGAQLRVGVAVVLVAAGVALLGVALYRQYVALPAEQTRGSTIVRAALVVGGLALLVTGSRFLE